MRRTVAVLAACVAVAAAPTPAWADTTDDQYLALLAKHGIPVNDPAAMIGAGHDECWALEQNSVVAPLAQEKPEVEFYAQGLSNTQVMQAQRDAVNAFCPDKAWWRD